MTPSHAPPTAGRRARRAVAPVALAASLLVVGAACSDDGAAVRSASGSASGSGSVSGSGSGLSADDVKGKATDDGAVTASAQKYRAYVSTQVDTLVERTTVFTDAVRAGDVGAAKAAFAPSRQAWERIEPIAGLVSDIDGAVDSRVDDFESPDDPAFTGWHRLEHLLWVKGTTDGGAVYADKLDEDLSTLQGAIAKADITPLAVVKGAAELIEEVSEGKISGEEDRYSHTDLWDFAANVEGAKYAWRLVRVPVAEADAELAEEIDRGFSDITAQLSRYRQGEGYKGYGSLTPGDKAKMKATLAGLSEHLSQVPGTLGLT